MTAQLCEETFLRGNPLLATSSAVTPDDSPELSFEALQEEWRIRLQNLHEWICLLLIKNQQLRMELIEAKSKAPSEADGNSARG